MPKKHNHNSRTSQSAGYIHPSLSSSKPIPGPSPGPASVNERLAQLRREGPPSDATRLQRDLAGGSHQRSIPPAVSGLLGLPQVAPPAPTTAARVRNRLRTATPGPPPPRSWLRSNVRASPLADHQYESAGKAVQNAGAILRKRPTSLLGFHRSLGVEVVHPRSLTHHVLRKLAEIWPTLGDDALQYLSELSHGLRSTLISYIASYGPEDGLSPRGLAFLYPELGRQATADLTGLAGWTISMKDVCRVVRDYEKVVKGREVVRGNDISESWDDDVPSIPTSLASSTAMTSLSLAHPPNTVSWSDLLTLTSYLPTLTHLSLADWPYPTKTPNLDASFYTTATGERIPIGGSSMYSRHDLHYSGAYAEAAVLLRQLSRNTYCLQYLDLSGCTWVRALIPWERMHRPHPSPAPTDVQDGINGAQDALSSTADGFHTKSPTPAPEWNGSWARLTKLKLAQLTMPESLPLICAPSSEPSHSLPDGLAQELRHYFTMVHEDRVRFSPGNIKEIWRAPKYREPCSGCGSMWGMTRDGTCRVCDAWFTQTGLILSHWAEGEEGARVVGKMVQTIRRSARGQALTIDHGWIKR